MQLGGAAIHLDATESIQSVVRLYKNLHFHCISVLIRVRIRVRVRVRDKVRARARG